MGRKNGQCGPIEIITTNVAEQPVVRAWRALGATQMPARVEMLRRRNKSVVYRLPGVGPAREDVIAKHCVRDSALAERDAYVVLQTLPVSQPEYHGFVEGEREGFGWLFLGDAAGERFEPEDAKHRVLATEWLASLHTASSQSSVAAGLPERGPAHYWKHLVEGRAALDRVRTEMDIDPAEAEILADVRSWLDRIAARWGEIEAICHSVPWALVHGDFAARNVRLRRQSSGAAMLLVFDWEVAGWGMPGVDLMGIDVDLYHALVRSKWSHLERETSQRSACVGRLLRGGVAAVHWDALKYAGNPCHALDDMLVFRQRIIDDLEALQWDTGTPRNFEPAPPRRVSPMPPPGVQGASDA